MLPKRQAFLRSLVNSSLNKEIGRTSHSFLTGLSLFDGNPLCVQADAAAPVNGFDIYLFARHVTVYPRKQHVFARSRFMVESIECLGQARDYSRKE